MKQLDTIYRALIDYRKNTLSDRECELLKKSISESNVSKDLIEIVKTECVIDDEWVNEIERGLEYVEKALKEERQFIRSNGEIVPIEKVKHISRESVEHLARHSNFISKIEEGKDITPDQIYTVERLSDFAVYENRFLYMLLCYLRDFISVRYNKILEISNTYNGKLTLKKEIHSAKHTFSYDLNFFEERRDDDYLKERNETQDKIVKINLLLKTVMVFLSTPLMQEVAKVPMVRPPITKTNVLKMNNNFKGALALYDYVSSYNTDGFTIQRKTNTINAFGEELADEIAETAMLTSFLTYEYGLDIKSDLKKRYERAEIDRQEAESLRIQEQIKSLKRRLSEMEISPEEYILALEKRNRLLENDNSRIFGLKREIQDLSVKIETLNETIKQKDEEIISLIKAHAEELERLNNEHQAEKERVINELTEKHAQEIESINNEYQAQIEEINANHLMELDLIKEEHENELLNQKQSLVSYYDNEIVVRDDKIASLKEKYKLDIEKAMLDLTNEKQARDAEKDSFLAQLKDQREKNKQKLNDIQLVADEINRQNDQLKNEIKTLLEQKAFNDARLNALRKENNLLTPTDDFTSREAFLELEHQFEVFKAFFKDEWKKTKKQIRKNVFAKQKDQGEISTPTQSSVSAQQFSSNNTEQKAIDEVAKALDENTAINQQQKDTQNSADSQS